MTIVVKLGGSLGGSPLLDAWLQALDGSGQRMVIVPGGGPFADAVRLAQGRLGFDDAAAHKMALLAMAQFGLALASRCANCRMASTASAIKAALAEWRLPVWMPLTMAGAASDIPASWDITSDSLAAWLAGRIGARRLMLVKQVDAPHGDIPASDLATQNIVDPAFPGFLARSGAQAWIAGPGALAGARAALANGSMPGQRITLP